VIYPAFTSYKRSPDGATTDLWWRPSNCSRLLIYQPQKDTRLSWPSWMTYSGQFIHIGLNGYPSAVGRAQRRKSSPVNDRRSTTVPRNQQNEEKLNLTNIRNISSYPKVVQRILLQDCSLFAKCVDTFRNQGSWKLKICKQCLIVSIRFIWSNLVKKLFMFYLVNYLANC